MKSDKICLKKTYCTCVEHTNRRKWQTLLTPKNQKEMQTKLAKGLLEMIVLQLLDQEPMHGYQLMRQIHRNFGVNFGASTVYPFLDRLECKGFLKSEWNTNALRPQKIFSITNEGRSVLAYAESSLSLIRKNLSADKKTPFEISIIPPNSDN